MIKKLINWSIAQLSTRVNYQAYHKFEPLSKNNPLGYSREHEASRAYFNNKLEDLQTNCKEIISSILGNPKDVTKNQQLLSNYLDIHGSVNRMKSARGLLLLLVVVNMTKQPALYSYNKAIFEHLVRNRVQEQKMDTVMLKYFLQLLRYIFTTPLQKAKYQNILYLYLNITKANLQLVHLSEYFHIINIITAQKKNRLYFCKFGLKIQQFFVETYYSPYLQGKTNHKIQAYMKNMTNLISMLKLMNYYNCTKQNGELMYDFIERFYLKDKMNKDLLNFDFITKIYRYYPYSTKDALGVFHKTKVRNQIIAYLQTRNISHFSANKKNLIVFCATIVHQIFYQKWMNLNFSQIDSNIFLQKDELKKPPTLPTYFWQLYSQNFEDINSIQILGDILKTMYPTNYIQSKQKYNKEIAQPLSETEMRIRMQIVLINLKIEYKKEVYVQGRFVDFLLEDNIALQLDGLLHFDPYEFKMDQKTTYRNIHLLYAGYKILVINIHEYNLNREVHQLTKLLQQKLAILKHYDCLAVL